LAHCAAWSNTSARTGPANRLATLPLIAHSSADAVIAYRGGQPLLARQFFADVARVAPALGAGAHVLNACADRYHFAVGLAACLVTDKVSLLPPTHTPEVMQRLLHFAPDLVCLTDEAQCDIELPRVRYPLDSEPATVAAAPVVPQIDSARLVAYVFTSGSTGTPVAHAKTWGRLTACVREEADCLGLGLRACAIVATVPPQHMYGFESSLLLALLNGHALCAERPFYPADISVTLAAAPRPRILVSTPVHLRVLLGSGVELPDIDLVVCSTAPLAQQLALEVEERCHTRLLEIYGSTETGQIAVRRPTMSPEWRLWPGVTLTTRDGETWAQGGHIEEPTRMSDVLELTGPSAFLLHGRVADLVNIAGKRSSLAYLNHQLNSVPGVLDGAFFHPDEPHAAAVARVGACVVAPGLDPEALLAELRLRIDPAFLPRPLLMVARLPRNSTGKLPQAALRSLAAANQKTAAAG
jgi:acyl-coenzyme A synthetase/AMP-(fatty) acid ligase